MMAQIRADIRDFKKQKRLDKVTSNTQRAVIIEHPYLVSFPGCGEGVPRNVASKYNY